MADDIKAKIELVDKMSNEFKEVASKVDKSVNSLKNSADKASTAFKETNNAAKQAGREMSIVGNQGAKGMQQISEAAQGLGSQVRNLGTSVIRGDLGGAVMAVSQVSTQSFKAMGLQAALATGAIGLAVGGLSIIASKISDAMKTIDEKQKETQANIIKYEDIVSKIKKTSQEKELQDLQKANKDKLKEYDTGLNSYLESLAKKLSVSEDFAKKINASMSSDKLGKAEIEASTRSEQIYVQHVKDKAEQRKDLIADLDTAEDDLTRKHGDSIIKIKDDNLAWQQEVEDKSYRWSLEAKKQYYDNLDSMEKERGLKIYNRNKQEEEQSKTSVEKTAVFYSRDAAIKKNSLQTEKSIAAEEKRIAAERNGYINSFIDGLINLNQQTKGNANVTKGLYIGKAIMNTGMGVTEALANPMTWPLVPWILGTGAVQIANIAAQKFAKGGIVQGDSRSGDNVNVRANAGEMMLTDEQQSRLFKIASGEEKSGGMVFNFNFSKGINTREIVTHMNELARDGYFSNAYHLKRALAA